jgi:hypothetical protein
VLHNVHQFHAWQAELEAACARETEEKYRRYAALLRGHLDACGALQDKVCVTGCVCYVCWYVCVYMRMCVCVYVCIATAHRHMLFLARHAALAPAGVWHAAAV